MVPDPLAESNCRLPVAFSTPASVSCTTCEPAPKYATAPPVTESVVPPDGSLLIGLSAPATFNCEPAPFTTRSSLASITSPVMPATAPLMMESVSPGE